LPGQVRRRRNVLAAMGTSVVGRETGEEKVGGTFAPED
jgi:hypothetical protein